MERDFLGINAKNSEDSRGDSGGSIMQWPFLNKATSSQQLVSFKSAREDKLTKFSFDHHSTSGFQPVNMQPVPQNCFNIDRLNSREFSVHPYQTQSIPQVAHNPIPVSATNPFFKSYGSSSTSTLPVYASTMVPAIPRNVTKTAQLTIFYAGSVNVYDDVSFEKAQAVMYLASKGNNANQRADFDTKSQIRTPTQTQIPLSSPVGFLSRSSSTNTDEIAGIKCASQVPPSLTHDDATNVATTSMPPRAVPQARKASLARFLEKRKERVTSTMPYSSSQKSTGNSQSSSGVPWCIGKQINNTHSGDSPNTELEI